MEKKQFFESLLQEDEEREYLTVAELIERLQQFDPDEEVHVLVFNRSGSGGSAGHAGARRVERSYGTLYIEG